MTRSHPILVHLSSLGALVLALMVRSFMDPWLHDAFPLVTLFAAVAVAVWIGGYRPAILVTLVGYLACDYLFISPRHEITPSVLAHLTALGACAITSGVIIGLGEAMRSASLRARGAMHQLEVVTATMAAPVTRCNRKLEYVWVSQGYADWLNRPVGDIVGRKISDVLGQRAFDQLLPYFERVLDGETVSYEALVPWPGIGERWISATYIPTRDQRGVCDGWVATTSDIDNVKRAEEAFRESEARFRLALKDSPIVAFTCDRELRYTWIHNPQLPVTDPARILGRRDDEMLPPEMAKELMAIKQDVLESGTGERRELCLVHEGEEHWYDCVIEPVFDERKSVVGLRGLATDITARKKSEQQTRADLDAILRLQAVANLCAAANTSPETCMEEILHAAIAFTNADFGSIQLIDENECLYFAVRFGFDHAFLNRFQTVRAGDPTTCAAAMRTKERVIVEDVTRSELFRGQPSLEALLECGIRAVQSTPLISSTGVLIGLISTHYRRPTRPDERSLRWLDLLARQAADYLERTRVQDELRDSEERYRLLFESIDQGFCVIEVLFSEQNQPIDYRFLVVNPAFERQTGISDATGRRMREIAPLHEEHWFEKYGRIALTGDPMRFESEAAQLNRHYEVNAWRIGERGEHKVAILFNDITQRKRQEEALREADRRKDEFLAVLSHELRNPLAPIGYATELLKKEPLSPGELTWIRDVMDRQVHQMGRLLDDLLDVARITRGVIDLNREHVELRSVVNDAVEASRPFIERSAHQLIVQLPTESIIVDVDPTRLAQVFLNLLNNAARYTDRGGQIRLDAWREDNEVMIRVKDNGIGIEHDVIGQIFDMFVQAGRPLERTRGGLGIGLTLVKRLVSMHGGTVQVHSDGPGQGSEFVVRLPVVAKASLIRPDPMTERASQSLRVLVVDDNRDAVDGMAIFLRTLGHDVRIALDGHAAVEEAVTFRPDAAILDIGLPKMNGYDVARIIRDQLGDTVVLIALTGWGQDSDRQRSADAGFDRHLVKPVDLDELQQLLATVRMPAAETRLRPAA
ncbi:MAG TPA: PAS domain-containing protein [Candidatus Krumholzibacteria bacterium]